MNLYIYIIILCYHLCHVIIWCYHLFYVILFLLSFDFIIIIGVIVYFLFEPINEDLWYFYPNIVTKLSKIWVAFLGIRLWDLRSRIRKTWGLWLNPSRLFVKKTTIWCNENNKKLQKRQQNPPKCSTGTTYVAFLKHICMSAHGEVQKDEVGCGGVCVCDIVCVCVCVCVCVDGRSIPGITIF